MDAPTFARLGTAALVAALEFGGVPLPGGPLLVAVASTETGLPSTAAVIVAAAVGALVADTFWFVVGRRRGEALVHAYCRVTLGSQSCAATTTRFFERLGPRALVVGKFVPGLAAFGAPFAGLSGVPWSRFLGWDLAGSVCWAATWVVAGRLLGPPLMARWTAHAGQVQVALAAVLASMAVAMLLGRLWRRRRSGPLTTLDVHAATLTVPAQHHEPDTADATS